MVLPSFLSWISFVHIIRYKLPPRMYQKLQRQQLSAYMILYEFHLVFGTPHKYSNDSVLPGIPSANIYIDDVVIASATPEQHLKKVQAVHNFPLPQSQCQLRQFIGLMNFYHRFLTNCADLMQPFHALLTTAKSKSSITWNNAALTSFNATKEALAKASLLRTPLLKTPLLRMPRIMHVK